MRQAAWLNARPKKADGDKGSASELSRRERLAKEGITHPAMPPCQAEYLLGYLFEMGPTAQTGMGEVPITHRDIAAWMGNTGIRLSPWQARTLHRLSLDYVTESHKATRSAHPAPWQAADQQLESVLASNNIKDAIRNVSKL
ncbi:MAG: hypothetical protein KA751_10400 [Comamonas sp.]|nr:hypothetical protein [Comamonas sp.]